MTNAIGQAGGPSLEPEWVLRRNCALTPVQLLLVFASLALISLGISLFWALQGAWVVVPFALVEILALAVAFMVYARHAADCERVRLGQEALVVERTVGAQHSVVQLPRAWLRVRLNAQLGGLVEISSGGSVESVGRFVDRERRELFFSGLRRALQA